MGKLKPFVLDPGVSTYIVSVLYYICGLHDVTFDIIFCYKCHNQNVCPTDIHYANLNSSTLCYNCVLIYLGIMHSFHNDACSYQEKGTS